MKVLLTATVQSHIVQFHKPLVKMLHEKGNEVHVAARDNLYEKNGLKLDFVERVFNVPFSRSPKSIDNIRAYNELKKIISIESYDVIHCNTPMGGVITRLASFSARKKGTKVIYTAHGFHFYKGAPIRNWLLYYPIEKWLSNYTDALITINEEDYRFAQKKMNSKIFHIHGAGVDDVRFNAIENKVSKEQLGIPVDSFVILCVGELLPNKNQIVAIKAVERIRDKYPNVLLLIAGNGPQKDNLTQYIKNHGLGDNVRLIGYCTNLEDYQRIASVGVSCSIREGLGFNIIEAMLSGNPVIATDNRGHSELIRNGVNGYIIKQGDYVELSERIEQLLLHPQIRCDMGTMGMNLATPYTSANVSFELKKIYEDVIGG